MDTEYKTYTLHFRNRFLFRLPYLDANQNRKDIFSSLLYKWITVVFFTQEGNIMSVGMSRCSMKDNPSKKIEYKIAHGRGLKKITKNIPTKAPYLSLALDNAINIFLEKNKLHYDPQLTSII